MATHETLTSLLSDVADAIREKTGDTATIVADNFPTAIRGISSGNSVNVISSESATFTLTQNSSLGYFVGLPTDLMPSEFVTAYTSNISSIPMIQFEIYIKKVGTIGIYTRVCGIRHDGYGSAVGYGENSGVDFKVNTAMQVYNGHIGFWLTNFSSEFGSSATATGTLYMAYAL